MTYPSYVKEKARFMRTEGRLSIVEIAQRLSLPKATVYGWLRDIPLQRPRAANAGAASSAMQDRYRRAREAARADGYAEFDELAQRPDFRDFVCLYIAEGSKRSRNRVAIGNSDPAVVRLSARWIGAYAANPLVYSVQYHADQDLDDLRAFWGASLGVRRQTSAYSANRTVASSPGARGGRATAC